MFMSSDQSAGSTSGVDGEDHDSEARSDLGVDGRVVEMGSPTDDEVVRAAGCVVYRAGPNGLEVLVVHRPRYDDWDLPKGKREPDESDIECAIRETEEESGFRGAVEAELAADTYQVRGRDKVVRWFLMRCTDGAFQSNDEVDEIRWLPPDEAREILSYGHARSLVETVATSLARGEASEE
jgi:8-oxo-dGTP diphosphatase